MRITFVLPYAGLAGGIRIVAEHAERLQRRGHEVVAVSTPLRRASLYGRVRALLRDGRWPAAPRPTPSHFDGLAVEHRVLREDRTVRESDVPDADVVVATFWANAPWVHAFPARKGAQVYFLQGYEVPPGETRPEVDAAWRLPLRKIVISRWLQRLAAERFGDPGAVLVPNAVDPARFHAPPRGRQSRPTVGFLYANSPFKAPEVLIEAVDRLRRRHADLRVVAFGAEAPDPRRPLPPGTEYHRLPPQERLRELYASCDVWLCGSRRDGLHLPLLEAMACRCPVVSTRAGGPEDLVEPGANGWLVDVDDAAGLAEAASRILDLDEPAWAAFSDAALATARRHDWDASTGLMEAALRGAAEGACATGGAEAGRGAR